MEEEITTKEVEKSQRGRTYHGNPASVREKRVGMEIKGRVSFRRRRVNLYPERSNEVRSRKKKY